MRGTITVVIASYRYGSFVAHALESVLAQTLLPDRILVVDDGAHDGVGEIVKKYQDRVKIKLDYLERENNLGIVKNFNDILMNRTDTDRMMILGADNWLRPDALEKMDVDADIVSSDMYIVGPLVSKRAKRNDKVKEGYMIRVFQIDGRIRAHNYIHGSSLYNVRIAQQYGYHPHHKWHEGKVVKNTQEDWWLWRQMILKSKAKHVHISEPLLYYRRHMFNFNTLL